jgi:dihydropyrimidinase
MPQKIIKSGTLITASDTFIADILIEGEVIVQIGTNLTAPDAEVIDARGKLVMPGGVDPHTHFDLPMFGTVSSDDHYTGHKAAAFGGTTTVIDFVSQDAPTLSESVDRWHVKADATAAVDFSFHCNVTALDPGIEKELSSLYRMGISSIKVFTAYNNRLRLQDGEIFRVMRIARENGLLTMLHAENGDVIDSWCRGLKRGKSHSRVARTHASPGSSRSGVAACALAAQPGAGVSYTNAAEVDS